MDLLNPKRALITVSLLGAMLLTADESEPGESSERLPKKTDAEQELSSTDSSVTKESPQEPTQTKTSSSQATDLKPLELRERIRAHANIDLPQDI